MLLKRNEFKKYYYGINYGNYPKDTNTHTQTLVRTSLDLQFIVISFTS